MRQTERTRRTRRIGRALRALALGVLALSLPPGAARAQHGFVPPEDRPLHARLAQASVVAFATVTRVDAGRIAFDTPAALVGVLPPAFEVKRAPSSPPPFRPGERALLLLSGARSPYRWVEKPVERVPIADAAAEARWSEALRELLAVREDPLARRDLYARWLEGESEDLAAAGLRGLTDVSAMPTLLDEAFARARARVVADPGRPLAVRRRAVQVASRHPAGIEALLADLAAAGPDADPEIAEVTLRAALRTRSPGAEAGLLEALETPESELGAVGLRLSGFAESAAVERRLSELAVGHPEDEVRTDAVQALKRLRSQRGG